MSNILSTEKRLAVLAALLDGCSIRATERMTGVSAKTIVSFGLRAGQGAQHLHNRLARNLSCLLVDVDEQHSFVFKRQVNVEPGDSEEVGEQWSWLGLSRLSRFAITWHVGKRDQENADAFVADLRARLVTMPKLMTSDGLSLYEAPMARGFVGGNYAQMVKADSDDVRHDGNPFITKRAVFGAPDLDMAKTWAIERQNLTNRHMNGRLRRKCLAFSKKLDNHRAAVALTYCWYNLGRVVSTLRCTPAVAEGVVDHVWELDEFLDAIMTAEPCETPDVKPLAHRPPEGTARALPGARGFLRAIPGGKGSPGPAPAPATPPAAPAVPVPAPMIASAASPAVEVDPRQMDLFSWRPKPRPMPGEQLSLFGDDGKGGAGI